MDRDTGPDGRMARAGLRCEGVLTPLGIDAARPRFSWALEGARRGEAQTAYQLAVVEAAGGPAVWDSGRCDSAQSVVVAYDGPALKSATCYAWRVRLWDDRRVDLGWTRTATFETGLLSPDDWRAPWIAGRLLRRAFVVRDGLIGARLYASGIGWSEVRLNGAKVGDRVLEPGQTDYDARVPYATYDVGPMLRTGPNVLGALLGGGRYAQAPRVGTFPYKRYADEPALRAQLVLRYADGTEETVATDGRWLAGDSPIVADDIYDGERYDARRELSGWDSDPQADLPGWRPAEIVAGPAGVMCSNAADPPIRVVARLPTAAISEPRPGVHVVDFGQTFTGWVRLKVRGPRGREVTLRFAEVCGADGMINTLPNRRAKVTDSYILKGDGEEVWEPRFTYHSFRFVEVTGWPGALALDALEGCVVRSDVPEAGTFSCSNPLIGRIQNAIRWTLTSNLMSIPTDCAARDERMGWMGDAHLAAEVNAYNFDMAGFYAKYAEDMIAAQQPDGAISDVVPPYWSLYPSDPTWGAACVIIPWTAHLFSGDVRILERAYPMGRAFLDLALKAAESGVLTRAKFGDWASPSSIPSLEVPAAMVATWYCHHCAGLLARMARALGRPDEAAALDAIAERLAGAYNEAFLDGDWYAGDTMDELARKVPVTADPGASEAQQRETTKRLAWLFAPPAQTAQLLPLQAGIVPDNKRSEVIRGLLYNIADLRAGHVGAGIVGTRYLFDVLTELGQGELAYKVATQTTYPSWGYMLREGATTLWERWEYLDGSGMNTHNQAMFGTIGAWFYKALAGLSPDADRPGFAHVVVKPHLLGDLQWAGATIRTPRGAVSSAWRRDAQRIRLEVEAPVNSTASVFVPKPAPGPTIVREGGAVIWNGKRFAAGPEGVTAASDAGDWVEVSVGSGRYAFTAEPA